MKIRIGVGTGAGTSTPGGLTGTVDALEAAGVDSLWLSEFVYSAQVDPFIGMAHALSRTAKLKVGTGVAVLPGRNPLLVAKQLASLADLSPGRVLPVFGLRPARRGERELFPAPPGRRGALFDESLHLLRLALSQDEVTYDGEFFSAHNAAIGRPTGKPLDIWLGGASAAALRRVGRYGDGWLASFLTPDETRRGRETIEAEAAEAGREIEDDHFGVSFAVAGHGIPDELAATTRERRPDLSPGELVAESWPRAQRLVEHYLRAGITKFVVRPADPAEPFADFLEQFTSHLVPMQN